MAKSKRDIYDPFKEWPRQLQRDVNTIGGSVLALASLAVMHHYPDRKFTSTSLLKALIEKQKPNVTWIPNVNSATTVISKLGYDLDLLDISERPSPGRQRIYTEAQINSSGQERAGYVGKIFRLCANNPGIYPQAIIGNAIPDITNSTGNNKSNPSPSARLGLYALLGTEDRWFSMSEVNDVLNLGQGYAHKMVRLPIQQGILELERQGTTKPSYVKFTKDYREPMMNFSSDIESLGNEDGIADGHSVIKTVMEDSSLFSDIMALGDTWAKKRHPNS